MRLDFFNIGVFDRLDGVLKKNWFVNILTGWSFNRANVHIVQNELINQPQTMNIYHFNNLFSEVKLKKKINELTLSFGGRLRNASVKFNQKSSDNIYFEPTVGVVTKKRLGNITSELKGLYNIENVFLNPSQLIGTSLLTNYRTEISFKADPGKPVRKEIAVASIKLTEDQVSFLSANAEWGYLKSSAILAPRLMFKGAGVVNNQLQGDNLNRFFSTYSLDKYFAAIRSSIKVTYEYNKSKTPLTIENQQDNSELSKRIFSITSGSSITQQLSLSLSFKNYQSQNTWRGNKNRFNFNNYFAKIVFKPFNSVRLTLDYQAIHFRQSNDFSSIFNTTVFYSILDNKLSVELTGNNLANQSAVALSTLTPSVFSSAVYPLQPMFILVSVKYRF